MPEQPGELRACRQPALTREQRWSLYELIFEGVKAVHEYVEQELDLELQLEEVRSKKHETKEQTLNHLGKLEQDNGDRPGKAQGCGRSME